MEPLVTVIVPVWDDYVHFLPRCLDAIAADNIATSVVLVDNASEQPLKVPPGARRVTLANRLTIGAARNFGLQTVDTPYVVFADADDEIAPGALRRGVDLLQSHPKADAVLGRSLVDEGGRDVHQGIRPTARYRRITRFAPSLVPLLWLLDYQGSLTSTILRTRAIRDAGGFADTNLTEDWHLGARLARRGGFVCIDEPVRIYHRHNRGLRARPPRVTVPEARRAICMDCRKDSASTPFQRLAAASLILTAPRLRSAPRTRITRVTG